MKAEKISAEILYNIEGITRQQLQTIYLALGKCSDGTIKDSYAVEITTSSKDAVSDFNLKEIDSFALYKEIETILT